MSVHQPGKTTRRLQKLVFATFVEPVPVLGPLLSPCASSLQVLGFPLSLAHHAILEFLRLLGVHISMIQQLPQGSQTYSDWLHVRLRVWADFLLRSSAQICVAACGSNAL